MTQRKAVDRQTLLNRANNLLRRAKEGIAVRKKQKSRRVVGSSNLLNNAPHLYIEDEMRLYIETAEAFYICSKWIDAAEAYAQAAWINVNDLKKEEEAAILYTEAGLCAMKFGIGEGEKYFKQAVSCYCACGMYGQAGRIRYWIASNYEDSNQAKLAITEYKMTVKYFEASNMVEAVLDCERKLAHLLCTVREYEEASSLYHSIGMKELRHNLTKYNAHHSFLKSSLLLLLGEMKGGDPCTFSSVCNNMKKAMEADFRFEVSASCDFLHNIVQILRNESFTVHDFVDHLYDYDSLYPLDECSLDVLEEVMHLRYETQLSEIDKVIQSES